MILLVISVYIKYEKKASSFWLQNMNLKYISTKGKLRLFPDFVF